MRNFVSIFLLFLFLSQTFSSFVLDGMYCFNRNYVAKTLCENKARPQVHCNGKCYLSKQIEKDSRETSTPSGNKKESGNEVYFFPVKVPVLSVLTPVAQNFYPQFIWESLSSYQNPLLRPPQIFFV